MDTKQKQRYRFMIFEDEILPLIEEKYKVLNFGKMFKIIINQNLIYDYYPMAQRIRNSKERKWKKGIFTIEEFKKRFT